MISFRQKAFVILRFGIFAFFLFLLAGCTIEKYTGPVGGNLYVSSVDNLGNEVSGASIYLDGVLRSEVTPDTLKDILSGTHSLRIEKYGYDIFSDSDVVVDAYTTTSFEAILHISNLGALSVGVIGGTGTVIVDGTPLTGEAPAIFTNIPTGLHNLSLFKDGYFTAPDTLISVEIVWQETTAVYFGLVPGTVGNQVDNIAPDFTLLNDNLDSISFHNYRGHVVLVNFWYHS
jgi:hypothetical protein